MILFSLESIEYNVVLLLLLCCISLPRILITSQSVFVCTVNCAQIPNPNDKFSCGILKLREIEINPRV